MQHPIFKNWLSSGFGLQIFVVITVSFAQSLSLLSVEKLQYKLHWYYQKLNSLNAFETDCVCSI